MSRPESKSRQRKRSSSEAAATGDGFDARAVVAVALLMGLGCVARSGLSSYSEGSGPEESASLMPAPAGEPAGPGAPPVEDEPAVDGEAPAAASSPEADESSAADAPLAPANAESPASAGDVDPEPATPAPNDAAPEAPAPAAGENDSCVASGGFAIAETDSCYLLGDAVFNWQDARDFCQAWGGDLVEIGSLEENMGLTERIDGSVWIGANDQDAEGMFRWASGAALVFTAWLANQPNDLGGNEDCAELSPFGGSWVDVPCAGELARQALCEQP